MIAASIEPLFAPAEPVAPGIDAARLLKAVGLADVERQAEETRAARRCAADLDGLGVVKPFVRDAAQFLACRYEEPDVLGTGRRSRASDRPRGLALDPMVRGDRIAECALANQDALGVSYVIYVIYEQRVNHDDGWERMSDRGGDTANHHVHVSFERGGGSGEALAERCSQAVSWVCALPVACANSWACVRDSDAGPRSSAIAGATCCSASPPP